MIRSRKFMCILYDDNINSLELIKKQFDFIYICHDLDTTNTGELKKKHYHVIFSVGNNPLSIDSVSKKINLPSNMLEPVHNYNSSLLYLTHYFNKEKYQYSSDLLVGSLLPDYFKSLELICKTNSLIQFQDIFSHIDDFKSIRELVAWCVSNGYYSTLRRNYSIFKDLIYESK